MSIKEGKAKGANGREMEECSLQPKYINSHIKCKQIKQLNVEIVPLVRERFSNTYLFKMHLKFKNRNR